MDPAVRTQGQKSQREKSIEISCLREPTLPISAFLLVLLAAFAHSTWNFLAKRFAAHRHLILYSSITEVVCLGPFAVWAGRLAWPRLSAEAALFLVATGVLHLLYTEALLRGYRAGDLSVVYPLARGTGPLISFFGAVLILHEHTSPRAVVGAVLITLGIFLTMGGPRALFHGGRRASIFWGAATGLTIASYTLVDGYSVKDLLLPPLVVDYAGNLLRTAVLSAAAWRERTTLWPGYRRCWPAASAIGLLTPAGYILVLCAMRLAPISHVAPVREMSMLLGVFLGARLLSEENMARRLFGVGLITAGVVALAWN